MWSLDLEKLKEFKKKFESKNMEAIVFTENNSGYHGVSFTADLNFGW